MTDSLQQYAYQLARELLAASQEGELRRPVLLTIGGLQDYSNATAEMMSKQIDIELGSAPVEYQLVCRSWYQVYLALQVAIGTADAGNQPGLRRLMNDIAATYEWHGLRTQAYRRLAQMAPVGIRSDTYPVSDVFRATVLATSKPSRLNLSLTKLSAPGIAISTFPIKTWSFRS